MKPLWIAIVPNATLRSEIETLVASYPNAIANVRITHIDYGYWWTPTDTDIASRQPFIDTANIDQDQILFPTRFRDEYLEKALYAWRNSIGLQERNISKGMLSAHYGGSIGLNPSIGDNLMIGVNPGVEWLTLSDNRIPQSDKEELYTSFRLIDDHIRSVRPDMPSVTYYDVYGMGGRNAGSNEYEGAEATALWVLDTIANSSNPAYQTIDLVSIDDTPLFGEPSFYVSNQTWLTVFNTIGSNLTFSHTNFKPFGELAQYANAWYGAKIGPDTRMINNGDAAISGNSNDGILGGFNFWKGFANQYARLLKDFSKRNQYSPSDTSLADTRLSIVGFLEKTYRGGILATDDPGSSIPVSTNYLVNQFNYLDTNPYYDAIGFIVDSTNLDASIGSSTVTMRDQLIALLSQYEGSENPPPANPSGYVISDELGQGLASDQLAVTYFKSLEAPSEATSYTYQTGSDGQPRLTGRQTSVCFPDVYYDKFDAYHGLDLSKSKYSVNKGDNVFDLPNIKIFTQLYPDGRSALGLIFTDSDNQDILNQLNLVIGTSSTVTQQISVNATFEVSNISETQVFDIEGTYDVSQITWNGETKEVTIVAIKNSGPSHQNSPLTEAYTWQQSHPSNGSAYSLTKNINDDFYTYTENIPNTEVSNIVTFDNLPLDTLEQTDDINQSSVQRLRLTGFRDGLTRNSQSILFPNASLYGDPRLNFFVGDRIRIDSTEYDILGHYIDVFPFDVYLEII